MMKRTTLWTPCQWELTQQNWNRALLQINSDDKSYAFDVRIQISTIKVQATDLLSISNEVDPKEVEQYSVLCEWVWKTSLELLWWNHMSLAQAVEYLVLELSHAIDEMIDDPVGYSNSLFFQNAELRAINTGRI